jgi:phosphoglycolate phosphatase
MMPAHRLVLFDIDGTLLRTQGAGRVSTRQAMLEVFGTAAGIDEHDFGGRTDWSTLADLLSPHGYDAAAIGRRMPHYEQVVARHLEDIINGHRVEPCPGALEVVQTLRDDGDTVLGLLTGNVSTTAPIKLRAAGFDPDWFAVGAYGSEALDRNDLPPLALARAIAHSGQPLTPEDVVIIGDTPADVDCARALGAAAVAVLTGFSTAEALRAANPDHLLDDLTALLAVLE